MFWEDWGMDRNFCPNSVTAMSCNFYGFRRHCSRPEGSHGCPEDSHKYRAQRVGFVRGCVSSCVLNLSSRYQMLRLQIPLPSPWHSYNYIWQLFIVGKGLYSGMWNWPLTTARKTVSTGYMLTPWSNLVQLHAWGIWSWHQMWFESHNLCFWTTVSPMMVYELFSSRWISCFTWAVMWSRLPRSLWKDDNHSKDLTWQGKLQWHWHHLAHMT